MLVQQEESEQFNKQLKEYDEKVQDAENLLRVFMSKAYESDMEAFIADSEYSYIEEADKRAFYMAIDLWKKDAGVARQGHKDFIGLAVAMIPQLSLGRDYKAYLALFECWPDTRLLDNM